MDPVHVVTSISMALGESSATAEALLRGLFLAFPDAGPADWDGVERALSAQPGVDYGTLATLLGGLKELAAAAGRGEDPRILFEDYELRGYFATGTGAPGADQPGGMPVVEGSLISRVGDVYYLGEGHQVWQAGSGDALYYHDGTRNYDALGRPLDAPDAAPDAAPHASGPSEDPQAWNSYLAANGPRWDGTEAAWAQFRDWFLYDADVNHLGTSAQGFIALAERGGKRAVFADYGVALPAAVASAGGGAPDLLDRLREEVMEPVLAHALSNEPRLAALGEDRLRELLAEVTAGHLNRHTG